MHRYFVSLAAKSTGLELFASFTPKYSAAGSKRGASGVPRNRGDHNCVKSGKCEWGQRLENRANNDVGVSVNRVRGFMNLQHFPRSLRRKDATGQLCMLAQMPCQ